MTGFQINRGRGNCLENPKKDSFNLFIDLKNEEMIAIFSEPAIGQLPDACYVEKNLITK